MKCVNLKIKLLITVIAITLMGVYTVPSFAGCNGNPDYTITYVTSEGQKGYPASSGTNATILTYESASKIAMNAAAAEGSTVDWTMPKDSTFSCWIDVNSGKEYHPGETIVLEADVLLVAVYQGTSVDMPENYGSDVNNSSTQSTNRIIANEESLDVSTQPSQATTDIAKTITSTTTNDTSYADAWIAVALLKTRVGVTFMNYLK